MKFISKLYFNTFKKIGNLRLIFVISCLLASMSLLIITPEAISRTYFYRVHTSLKPWEYFTLKDVEKNNFYLSKEDSETIKILMIKSDCKEGKIKLQQIDDKTKDGCEIFEEKYKNISRISIYSLSYLWNYLWVIFWFYFPFLIILPIKFVIDGYQQDKKGKNKKS